MRSREELGKCTLCGVVKHISQFNTAKHCKYGIRPECKLCEYGRGSFLLKLIRYRIKHLKWYVGITCDLTAKQIEDIPNVCFFCKQTIESGVCIHRIDHGGDYTLDNVAKTHKSCHAKHGGHTTKRRSR